MINTLESYINLLVPYIPGAIVNDHYLNCIRKISRRLPLLSFGCFEFWFDGAQPRVDFDISINGWINEHKLASAFFSEGELSGKGTHGPVVENILPFLNTGENPEFRLGYFIKQLWLAFDIPNPEETPYKPWYYVKFTNWPLSRSLTFKKFIIAETISLLNEPYPADFKSKLQSFFETVPPSVFISAIGVQTNRNIASLRAYLIIPDYEEIFRFLQRYNWPGNLELLRKELSNMEEGCIFYGLCIDLGPGLQPKIGVEFWFSAETANKRLKNLTGKLIEKGLCTEEKQKAFLDWEGTFVANNEPNVWSWPDRDRHSRQLIPKEVVIQRISPYVKIVYSPGHPTIAKGYLGFDRLAFNYDS